MITYIYWYNIIQSKKLGITWARQSVHSISICKVSSETTVQLRTDDFRPHICLLKRIPWVLIDSALFHQPRASIAAIV